MSSYPTVYNEDLGKQVRTLVLQDKENKEIQEILGINENTWESWYYQNAHGFRDLLNRAREERIIQFANANLKALLRDSTDKIKADLTKFALERLNKASYSARVEQDVTTKGEAITGINYVSPVQDKIEDSQE